MKGTIARQQQIIKKLENQLKVKPKRFAIFILILTFKLLSENDSNCTARQLCFVSNPNFDEIFTFTYTSHIIFRFIQSCTPLDVYDLPVRVEEERATTFERKDGFNYFVRLNYIYFDFAQKKKKFGSLMIP